jgi:hypothetical protein
MNRGWKSGKGKGRRSCDGPAPIMGLGRGLIWPHPSHFQPRTETKFGGSFGPPRKKNIHGLCTTSLSLPLWTMSTLYDITHLDTALRFMANGRKKIGWQQGEGNVLQKKGWKPTTKPCMLQGFLYHPISSPSLAVTRWVMLLTWPLAASLTHSHTHSLSITCIPVLHTVWIPVGGSCTMSGSSTYSLTLSWIADHR